MYTYALVYFHRSTFGNRSRVRWVTRHSPWKVIVVADSMTPMS
jgi:hypothetical protein